MTIQEAAEHTGMTAHTLRYYERIGLIQPVGRSSSGHRSYSEADLAWIDFLKKLRKTGMPIQEMKQYATLMWQGDSTSGARRQLLEKHQARMLEQLDELNDCLSCIEWKIAHYKEFESLEEQAELAY